MIPYQYPSLLFWVALLLIGFVFGFAFAAGGKVFTRLFG